MRQLPPRRRRAVIFSSAAVVLASSSLALVDHHPRGQGFHVFEFGAGFLIGLALVFLAAAGF